MTESVVGSLTLWLAGDVMLGRGIDQILPHPGDPSSRPGVHLVRQLSDATAARLCERASRIRKPGDVVMVSAHWGSNWGYEVDPEQVRFAHRLVDGGVDIVYGHSSHHPRPIEVYRNKLILYGCGDLVNDYEGIRGHEDFRPELRAAYLVRVSAQDGRLLDLRLIPLRAHQLTLRRAEPVAAEWLRRVVNEVSSGLGTMLDTTPSGELVLHRSGLTR
jgi:poly-gamma-glutamate capsule biosynthesis protein CapA/YwtB (metallophosphatase superfamily)